MAYTLEPKGNGGGNSVFRLRVRVTHMNWPNDFGHFNRAL